MKITFKSEIASGKSIGKDELLSLLLKNRGVTDIASFMHPPLPQDLSLKDFGYDREIKTMFKILEKIKKDKKKIVVYTDYDADGITGGSILWETLHLLGFDVMPYVPDRKTEGYGFSKKGIEKIKKEFDPALIMSVDHGITAVDQIAYAKELGIPVIVTDHHHKQKKIPEAAEIIFHIPALSGSGVAYFVAKEIFESLRAKRGKLSGIASSPTASRNDNILERNFKTDYLSLASIGTIADLVPLVGPSRSVVTYGLQAFSQVKRAGLQSICREAKIVDRIITPYEIGFIIAPRINAVGRLDNAIDALRLLCTTSESRATQLAGKVGQINVDRQELVKTNVEEAKKMVEKMKESGELPKIIILHSKDWHEGVIGLIASNIVEEYYRPAIIMTESDGQMKGSARSIGTFHITHFFEELKEYFLNFGGHAGAAGFTLPREKLEAFKKAAVKKADKSVKKTDLERMMEVDVKLSVSTISLSLAKHIESLQPFGIGNPQPSFVSDVEVISAGIFGKTNDHLKVTVKDTDHSSFPLEMIAFGKAPLFKELSRGQNIQIAYHLDINRWKGRESLRGRVMHISL